MFRHVHAFSTILVLIIMPVLTACFREDPGPLQEVRKDYAITDFDRLEMGDAFNIEVEHGNTFSIEVRGDRRNIDDLEVYKSGNTLMIKFEDNSNRHHSTYVDITMPRLESVNFSGASVSKIRGFTSDDDFDFYLSGASVSQLDADFREINLILSGASSAVLFGSGDELHGEVSGASSLKAFDYPVREATLNVTGASEARVTATDELSVTASGASSVLYRGNPSLTTNTSGASTVQKD
ncbi:head GIN domain-containing protein [Chryseolinea sp. H1M3-3]|uniref:head GIN domain-containing protein n=1 Tax=Chryseolinea sp. H1M3-3 TaxID=3034144 RepID=UPI0023EDE935|nr:head GIN domain-containing protein [Chryseolinea sp. H1M3-3]